jgi:two-component system, NtrC family, nitrogen regulation sensor histidine kinase GlnL
MNAPNADALWGAIPYPGFVIGKDDIILAGNNAAEVFSATSQRQMIGKPLARFVGEDSVVIDAIRQVRRGSMSVVQYDTEVLWGDRPLQSFTLHASQMADADGDILLLLHPAGMAAQMDRSLSHRAAARSVTGMAAMLAHEIRNPLAGITGAAQLLAMSLGDQEQELTDLIEKEAKRIGKLVEKVEAFGDLRPAGRAPVNIHDALDRAKRAAQAGYARHVRFKEEYDPSIPPAAGDADQLMQVFQNLIKNAAEAVPEVGGLITLRTGFRPGFKLTVPGQQSESVPLLITITDNGRGIPETLIRDIFDPFVSSKANGSGLGLSLVSKVMADHGGVVEVKSEPGRTQFRLRLPVWNGEYDDGSDEAEVN